MSHPQLPLPPFQGFGTFVLRKDFGGICTHTPFLMQSLREGGNEFTVNASMPAG